MCRTLIIEDINDRDEILDKLSRMYTDNDFNGENGTEYISEKAKEAGYESEQDFVINRLKKSDLKKYDLINAFCLDWFTSSSSYLDYDFHIVEHAGATIVTIVFVGE